MRIDPSAVEAIAKELYIRALKILPDDVKAGFETLAQRETVAKAQGVLATMIRNIAVAEATDNLLCQDTGIPDLQRYHRPPCRDRWPSREKLRFVAAASVRPASIHCVRRSSIHLRAGTSTRRAASACR